MTPSPKETKAYSLPPAQWRRANLSLEQLEAMGCTKDGCYRPGRAPKHEIGAPDRPWYWVLPYAVARSQEAWENRQRIMRGREQKVTFAKMATVMGVTQSRVRQMYTQALWEKGMRSPVEQWLAWDVLELDALARGHRYGGISVHRRARNIRLYYNDKNREPDLFGPAPEEK